MVWWISGGFCDSGVVLGISGGLRGGLVDFVGFQVDLLCFFVCGGIRGGLMDFL
jgi:hypothetical protein